MSSRMIDAKVLDQILDTTVHTVTESKTQIFEIGEQSRLEFEKLTQELTEIKQKVLEVIEKGDHLEAYSRLARARLSEVSKHFQQYNEDQIREAYENANKIQLDLITVRQSESQLRERRDDIERRLVNLKSTVDKADKLVGQISVVLNFLSGDLRQFGEMIKDAKQKQEFGLQIIEAQEEERRRLSREIHDGPAQMMANVLLRSELIERIYSDQGAKAAQGEIKDLRCMLKEALTEVRRIIYDLRPMALDDLGLIPTLEKYLYTVEDTTGITIHYRAIHSEERLPSRMEVAIFRLIQESIQNACKHSEANKIEVKMELKNKLITILVKDDGKGFDTKVHKENSFGLIGMKERVEMLEGKMKVDSKPNRGTFILIQIPINGQEEEK
jgi:two-component system sensor histidine kinase DegS